LGTVFDWQILLRSCEPLHTTTTGSRIRSYAGYFMAQEAAMQKSNGLTSILGGRVLALLWRPAQADVRSFVVGAGAPIIALLRQWCERHRQRRGLSVLGAHDLADLRVPTSLAADELRRWPWQPPSPQWQRLEADRQAARDGARAKCGDKDSDAAHLGTRLDEFCAQLDSPLAVIGGSVIRDGWRDRRLTRRESPGPVVGTRSSRRSTHGDAVVPGYELSPIVVPRSSVRNTAP
jgi:hypothetical protein